MILKDSKMNSLKMLGIFALLILSAILVSCSGGKRTIARNAPSSPSIPDLFGIAESSEISNRTVLAVSDASIDPISKTFTITQSNRTSDYHFPLTQLYPNVITITRYGFTPNFWADIKITHPLPNSGIDGFDPRVIAILPANPGVSMNYPTLNVVANDSVVLNPDGYTKLYDAIGGSIPGNTNPFLAYFKHVEYRRWFSSGTGMTSDTRRWEMDIDGFGGPMIFKLVVDVSTNYPNQPMQVVDNAPEPVQIEAIIGNGLTPDGGSASIDVTLLDWQGETGIGGVVVEAPDLFNGTVSLAYSQPGPNPNEYVFSGQITNELLAPAGRFRVMIAAWDVDTGIFMYKQVTGYIDITFNPVDVTPPWLNLVFQDIYIDGNYAYIASPLENSLVIFDISNPLNPVWVNFVSVLNSSTGVYVSNGYAYVVGNSFYLSIIDIDPPESAHVVKYVATPDYDFISGVCVSNGFAFVTEVDYGLRIIDIDPPESAYIVKSVPTSGSAIRVCVSNGFAYVASGYHGLQIIDIDPPESAYIVKSVDDIYFATDVYVSGSFAYVTDGYVNKLEIVDIDPPESANIVKTVNTHVQGKRIHISDGYAYLVDDYGYGFEIIDIDPPASAYTVKYSETPSFGQGVFVSGDYAYVADLYSLQIIDINPPESADIVKTIDSTYDARWAHISGDYAYATEYNALKIIDINPPEDANIIKSIDLPFDINGIHVSGDYAYVVSESDGLQIIDISPPESAYIVKSVDTPGYAKGVFTSGSYAYVADYWAGLQIIDVDPPELAQIVKSVETSGIAKKVCISGSYAYVTVGNSGFQIIDVSVPESAHVVKSVDTIGSANPIYVAGNYAYTIAWDGAAHFLIIDIDPPESASVVKSIELQNLALNWVFVSDGFAYATDNNHNQLEMIDIDPPESAFIVGSVDTHEPTGVFVSGNYAYVTGIELRIIKLW